MTFLLYERILQNDAGALRLAGEEFRLAGYNLIYKAWEQNGRPIDQGWHVSADELIRLHTQEQHDYRTRRLVIDFDPRSDQRIGLIEILDIYAYTYQNGAGKPAWTPVLLRMRDVFYKEYDQKITPEQKQQTISLLPEPLSDADFIEFLYLQGSDGKWNWGRNGSTNAVFIQNEARTYFRQFF